jgi:tetratricopeptide (TPR) repeat protein
LANLDWQRLYKDQYGFLLFEDTKKGWETGWEQDEKLKPDYVLIDSRTGDTDVRGICTRQLPDSVVLMFTPNEQNLVGLENVCDDIRREATQGIKKTIQLHFVAANVPDLDDEDGILRRQLAVFSKRLGIPEREKPFKIRRYESLRLLDQSVFTLDRPRTRLARSFQRLTETLIRYNLADRDAALRCLKDYAQQDLPSVAPDEFTPRVLRAAFNEPDPLNDIASRFLDDAVVLYRVAQCRKREGDFEAAVNVLTRALTVNPNLAPALYERALGRAHLGDGNGAAEDLLRFLRTPAIREADILRALSVLHPIAPEKMPEAVDLPAVQALPDKAKVFEVCPLLTDSDEGLEHAITIHRHLMASGHGEEAVDHGLRFLGGHLSMYLLAARRWREVIELLQPKHREPENVEQLYEAFFLALAYWGETGDFPEDRCRVILRSFYGSAYASLGPAEVYDYQYENLDVIGLFCWVWWRTGRIPEALEMLEFASGAVTSYSERTYSFWRCRYVNHIQYLDDCQQLRRMIQGESLRPAFLGPAPVGTASTPSP